jgi:hypothetical protein
MSTSTVTWDTPDEEPPARSDDPGQQAVYVVDLAIEVFHPRAPSLIDCLKTCVAEGYPLGPVLIELKKLNMNASEKKKSNKPKIGPTDIESTPPAIETSKQSEQMAPITVKRLFFAFNRLDELMIGFGVNVEIFEGIDFFDYSYVEIFDDSVFDDSPDCDDVTFDEVLEQVTRIFKLPTGWLRLFALLFKRQWEPDEAAVITGTSIRINVMRGPEYPKWLEDEFDAPKNDVLLSTQQAAEILSHRKSIRSAADLDASFNRNSFDR